MGAFQEPRTIQRLPGALSRMTKHSWVVQRLVFEHEDEDEHEDDCQGLCDCCRMTFE
jgi:hypothetical protein